MRRMLKGLDSHEIIVRTRRILSMQRAIATIVLIAMVLSMIPFQVFASDDEAIIDDTTQTTETEKIKNYDIDKKDIPIVAEDTSRRAESEKHFRKQDGSYEVVLYDGAVHYQDGDEWLDIDNTLDYDDDSKTYKNKANKFDIKFPKDITNQDIKLKMSEYEIDWQFIGTKSSEASIKVKDDVQSDDMRELYNINEEIIYHDVLDGIDLSYTLSGSKIKEAFIVENYQEDLSFSFEYTLKNLSLIETDEGIILVDENGKTQFTFDSLIMFDNESIESNDIDINIEQTKKDTYIITITPSDEWLQQASYPVTIDPTLDSSTTNMTINDSCVYSYNPYMNFDDNPFMAIGGYYSNAQFNGLINFYIPQSISENIITYASLAFAKSGIVDDAQINIYQNTETFDSEYVTWNNAPDYENSVIDYYTSNSNTPCMFDITESVKEWQSDGISAVPGFTLILDEGIGSMNQVYQSEYNNGSASPKIYIGYESSAGLKDYWTYTSQNMGTLGTGYISDYTGNLTWIRNDYSLNNMYMSLSLSMIYNYAEKDTNVGYGNGWKTNYNMQMKYDEDIGQYYLYKPDGEIVYFRYLRRDTIYGDIHRKTYTAENGSVMKLTIVFDGNDDQLSTYQLTTKDNFYLVFENSEHGRLVQLRNTETTHDILIDYWDTSSSKIETISDEVGNNITFSYASSSFSTALNLIQDEGNELDNEIMNKTYYFDINNNLDYINENYDLNPSDGVTNVTQLDYHFNSSNQLIFVKNILSNQKLTYGYNTDKISSVTVVDDTDLVNQFSIDYNMNLTRYTSEIDQSFVDYSFDMYGHTVNISSSNGHTESYKYAGLFTYYSDEVDTIHDVINMSPNFILFHHLLESSGTKQQEQNPVQDSSFEYQNQWITSYQYSNTAYYSTSESVYGDYSIVIDRAIPIGVDYVYQNVYLQAGSYTVSGWIKNDGNAYNGSGACIDVSTVTSIDSSDEDVYGIDGWIYYEKTFTISTARTITIKLQNYSMSEAYFDQIQINEGYSDARYNLLENSGFESWTTGWVTNGLTPTSNNQSTDYESILGSSSLKIEGDGSSTQLFYQVVNGLSISGETINIGGWAKADAVPNKTYVFIENEELVFLDDGRAFEMKVVLDVAGTQDDLEYIIPFDSAVEQWQFVMQDIEVPDDITVDSITIYGIYRGENTAYFDNFQLYIDDLSQSYEYHESTGNVISFRDANGSIVTYTYDEAGEEVISIEKDGIITELSYTSTDLIEEVETNNVRITAFYDTYSKHIIKQQIGDENSYYYFTESTYQFDDQYLESQTNEFDNSVEYGYNEETGLIDYIVDGNSNQVSYEYDDFGRILDQYFESSEGDVHYEYVYTNDLLHEITVDDLTYTFNYNDFEQISGVEINNEVIVSYTYVTKTDGTNTYHTYLVETKSYANGDHYYFTYNNLDQLKTISFNNSLRYEYVYDSSGMLGVVKDLENNHIYNYNYDMSGKLETITDESGNIITYEYDTSGRVSTYTYDISGIERSVYFHYNQTTGEYDYTTYDIGSNLVTKYYNYQNDSLRRLNDIQLYITTNEIFQMTFVYDDNHVINGNSTSRVFGIQYEFLNDNDLSYYYYYDDNQNIVAVMIIENGTPIEQYQYKYNELNQLKRENININGFSATYTYDYDGLGNITWLKHYGYTTSSTISTTLYESKHITYDGIEIYGIEIINYSDQETTTVTTTFDNAGNITSTQSTTIDNNLDIIASVTKLYDWEGRRLTEYEIDEGYGGGSIYYEYNDQGIRTSKEVSWGDDYEYILDGDKVLVEIINSIEYVYYSYDVDGKPNSMTYDGDEYFYIYDLQGNVIGLMDDTGERVVEYKYDAWGNIIYQTNSSLAIANPYRYRGYRYDEETGYYYLQSRYYDPEIGRFLNMDDVGFLTADNAAGINLYAYCANNPVMFSDITGFMAEYERNMLIGTGIIVLLALATVITAGIAGVGIGATFAAGFTGVSLGTGAAATAATIATTAFASAIIGGTTSMLASGLMTTCIGGSVEDILNNASTAFMFGTALGMVIGTVNAIPMAVNETINMGIHMGINGLTSVGTYLGQTAYRDGDLRNVTIGGAVISAIGGASAGNLENSIAITGFYNYLSIQGAFFVDYTSYIQKNF